MGLLAFVVFVCPWMGVAVWSFMQSGSVGAILPASVAHRVASPGSTEPAARPVTPPGAASEPSVIPSTGAERSVSGPN